jgi:hypothetical protein
MKKERKKKKQFKVCEKRSVHYNANFGTHLIYTTFVRTLFSETLHQRSLERAKTEKESFTLAIIIKILY